MIIFINAALLGSTSVPVADFSWEPEIAETPPGSISFTRATTATVLTTTDGTTNWYQQAKSGEIRYEGLRRVENLLDSANGTGPFSNITKEGRVAVSVVASSGTLTITIGGNATVFSPTGTPQRFVAFEDVTGTTSITIAGTATLSDPMAHLVQVKTGGDLPEPYVAHDTTYNADVDGVRYFNTDNGNSVDGSGVVTEAAGATITGGGYLSEPATTNLTTSSSGTSAGVPILATETDLGVTDIGLSTARFTPTAGANDHFLQVTGVSGVAGAQRTLSLIVRDAGTGFMILRGPQQNSGNYLYWSVNFSTNTITDNGVAEIDNSAIQDLGNDWYRVHVTWTNSNPIGTNNTTFVFMHDTGTLPAATAATPANFNDVTRILDLAQVDYVSAAIPTSPLVTNGSTVTRNADVLAGTAWIASAPYSVFVDQTAPLVFDSENRILRLDTGVNDLETDGSGNITLTADTGLSLAPSGAITEGDRDKMAFRYAANDGALAVEGKVTVTDASVTVNVNAEGDLNVGGANVVKVHKIQSYNSGLTNSELENLVA